MSGYTENIPGWIVTFGVSDLGDLFFVVVVSDLVGFVVVRDVEIYFSAGVVFCADV